MSQTKIKICGIQDAATAVTAANLKADFVGLVFYAKSCRNIVNLLVAEKITATAKKHNITPVAVFVNKTALEIEGICRETGISTVQLHGKKSRAALKLLPKPIKKIYVVDVDENGEYTIAAEVFKYLNPEQDYLLFDTKKPGSGTSFDLKHFHYDGKYRFFLAGGLTSENVVQRISELHPYGVDVSSGVESQRGMKDINLIRAFTTRVQHG